MYDPARRPGSCGRLSSCEQLVLRGLQRHRDRAVQRRLLLQRRALDPRPERRQLAELRATGSNRRSPFDPIPPPRITSSGSTTDATATIASAIRCASAGDHPARLRDRRAEPPRTPSSRSAAAASPAGARRRRPRSRSPPRRAPRGVGSTGRAGRSRRAGGNRPRRPRRRFPGTARRSAPCPCRRRCPDAGTRSSSTPLPSPCHCSPIAARFTSFSNAIFVPSSCWTSSTSPCRPHPGSA